MENEKYYRSAAFVKTIAEKVKAPISDAVLCECFSQNKDELVMGFATLSANFFLVADCTPQMGWLTLHEQYARAKKNTVTIFEPAIGGRISEVLYHTRERSFEIRLANHYTIIFKLHGRNANVLLAENQQIVDIFRNNLKNDYQFTLSATEPISTEPPAEEEWHNYLLFVQRYKQQHYLLTEKEKYQKFLIEKIKKTAAFIQKTEQQISTLTQPSEYEKWGHILMAHLHLPIKEVKSYVFDDFYTDQKIEIPLKSALSLRENAEVYYRKSKNVKIEVEHALKKLAQKQAELAVWTQKSGELQPLNDLKNFRAWVKANNITLKLNHKTEEKLPYREIFVDGWIIWIGKNAKSNDLLTLKFAHKNDYWLHAKDVSGSHVVIKHQAGKNLPKHVAEKAASLAAFYSKRRNDTLAPVIFTQKKYVRKPKGMPEGAVVVDKEQIVLVKPEKE